MFQRQHINIQANEIFHAEMLESRKLVKLEKKCPEANKNARCVPQSFVRKINTKIAYIFADILV